MKHTNNMEPRKLGFLKKVRVIRVRGAEEFVAKNMFKVDISRKARVKISGFNNTFKNALLNVVDLGTGDANLQVSKLLRGVASPWIIVELGCDNYYVFLSHVWEAISLQPHGEKGVLLTDGSANIFFICDGNGLMWAVNVCWYEGGWAFYAHSIGQWHEWSLNCQVVSQ